jgi:hypothetical protein
VLAVGDEAFARKCLAKIAEFQQAGKTILFVTHSLDLVTELCTRGIVVERGRVQYDGDPAFAVGTLRRCSARTGRAPRRWPPQVGARLGDLRWRTRGRRGPPAGAYEPLVVRLDLEVEQAHDGLTSTSPSPARRLTILTLRSTVPGGPPGRVEVVFEVPAVRRSTAPSCRSRWWAMPRVACAPNGCTRTSSGWGTVRSPGSTSRRREHRVTPVG